MTAREPKQNQGMRQPQFGGIGSRLDIGTMGLLCRHGVEHLWRLPDGTKWICGICHPPSVQIFVRHNEKT